MSKSSHQSVTQSRDSYESDDSGWTSVEVKEKKQRNSGQNGRSNSGTNHNTRSQHHKQQQGQRQDHRQQQGRPQKTRTDDVMAEFIKFYGEKASESMKKLDEALANALPHVQKLERYIVEYGLVEPLILPESKTLEVLKSRHANGQYLLLNHAVWFKTHKNLSRKNDQRTKMFDVIFENINSGVMRKNTLGETTIQSLLAAQSEGKVESEMFDYMYEKLTQSSTAQQGILHDFVVKTSVSTDPSKSLVNQSNKDYVLMCLTAPNPVEMIAFFAKEIFNYVSGIKTKEAARTGLYPTVQSLIRTLQWMIDCEPEKNIVNDTTLFFKDNKFDKEKVGLTTFSSLQAYFCNIDLNELHKQNQVYQEENGEGFIKYNLRTIGAVIGMCGYTNNLVTWIKTYEKSHPDVVATCLLHIQDPTGEQVKMMQQLTKSFTGSFKFVIEDYMKKNASLLSLSEEKTSQTVKKDANTSVNWKYIAPVEKTTSTQKSASPKKAPTTVKQQGNAFSILGDEEDD